MGRTRVELGMMYTPDLARQRGAVLMRVRDSHGVNITLYREDRLYIVTTMHVITTLSSIERVGVWAFLHS